MKVRFDVISLQYLWLYLIYKTKIVPMILYLFKEKTLEYFVECPPATLVAPNYYWKVS
jgi:hypothetical protein